MSNNRTIYLILGGARSGKSRYAENLVKQLHNSHPIPATAYYLATAEALDEEMQARIKRHQQDRLDTEKQASSDFSWQLIEEPLQLGQTLKQFSTKDIVLIDCLTLWLSNCMHHDCWFEQKQHLIQAIQQVNATIVMVSNNVGQGIVPDNALARRFVDESGWLHQELAQLCDEVNLVTAGLAQRLK